MASTNYPPQNSLRSIPRRRGALKRSSRIYGILFTLPALVLVSGIVIFPLFQAAYYSFTNWNGADADWIGWSNYVQIFHTPELRKSLTNSLIIFLSIPIGMVFPFATAYLMSTGLPGTKIFRAIIFAPTALSWVVIGLVARKVFANDGPINVVMDAVGLEQWSANWLATPVGAMVALVITFNAAIFGINTVIFLTGLSTVDKSSIEAARLDGASELEILIHVVFPAVRRFIDFVFIITVILSFTGLFGLIFVLTAGGPGTATMTLEFSVWRRAFSAAQFGSGAAIGITLMVLTLSAVGVVRLLSGRKPSGDE